LWKINIKKIGDEPMKRASRVLVPTGVVYYRLGELVRAISSGSLHP
jgi:hypothetical protein